MEGEIERDLRYQEMHIYIHTSLWRSFRWISSCGSTLHSCV